MAMDGPSVPGGPQRNKRRILDDALDIGLAPRKRTKNVTPAISNYFQPLQAPRTTANSETPEGKTTQPGRKDDEQKLSTQIHRIALSNLTPFRRKMLSLLCQIPRGRYSTYQALSDHVTATSHKTCARAVGNAMKNNPFAPQVPCHRVLAADGTLGGFCGDWGEQGKFASKKHELLHEEGVRFDSRGKVKGPVFRDFSTPRT